MDNDCGDSEAMAVSSLFDSALQAVLRELPRHEQELPYLPGPVKGKIAGVMARRGLLCDRNLALVRREFSHLLQHGWALSAV